MNRQIYDALHKVQFRQKCEELDEFVWAIPFKVAMK